MSSTSSSIKVAEPYAEALFESSKIMQVVDQTNQDLRTVQTVIRQSKSLQAFLANPLIAMNIKKNVLKNIFIDQISIHVLNFLFILVERRRIVLFNPIVNCYKSLVNNLELVTLITVYTVIPLNDEQKQALQSKLQVLTNSKVVQLIIEIKPELIGGLVVKMGSKIIDLSIYGQLNRMSSYLNAVSL